MGRLFSKCKVKKPVQELLQSHNSHPVSYYQWYTSDNGKTRRECIADDCKEDLTTQTATI